MDHQIIHFVALICIGQVLLILLQHYGRRTPIPLVTWVMALGVLYGVIQGDFFEQLPTVDLNAELIFFIFVPLLIFSAAQQITLPQLRQIFYPAAFLATVGVLITAFLIALPIKLILGISWLESWLFGSIMAATDPIAISAIIANNGTIKEKLRLLIEGESLLNDGTAVVLFGGIFAAVFHNADPSLVNIGTNFLFNFFGALAIGAGFGYVGIKIIHFWHETNPHLKVTLSLLVAYGSFFVAEHYFHVSGILAVFAAALAFHFPDCHHKSCTGDPAFDSVWGYAEYLANISLFFLLGIEFVRHNYAGMNLWWPALALALLIVPRYIAVWSSNLFLPAAERFTAKERSILNFAGVRGAISIALLLMLPNSYEHKEAFMCLAFIMITISLIGYPIEMHCRINDCKVK